MHLAHGCPTAGTIAGAGRFMDKETCLGRTNGTKAMRYVQDMDATLMQNTRFSLELGRSTNGYHGQRGIDRAIAKGFAKALGHHDASTRRPAMRALGA